MKGKTHGVAGVFIPPRGTSSPYSRVAAGSEDDRIGEEHRSLARVDVKTNGSEALFLPVLRVDQQFGNVDHVDDRDSQLFNLRNQGVENGPSGVVAGVTRSTVGVSAKVPLVELTVFGLGEGCTPVHEFVHTIGRVLHQNLNRFRVADVVPFLVGVNEVLHPVVVRVDGSQGSVDAASSERGVGVVSDALPDDEDFAPALVGGNSGPQACTSRSDHEDVAYSGSVFTAHLLTSFCWRKFTENVHGRPR